MFRETDSIWGSLGQPALIETQKALPGVGKRPDMQFSFPEQGVILVENKWDAKSDRDQIRQYERHLQGLAEKGQPVGLVHITRDGAGASSVRKKFSKHCTWVSVANALDRMPPDVPSSERVLAWEFYRFMKELEMDGEVLEPLQVSELSLLPRIPDQVRFLERVLCWWEADAAIEFDHYRGDQEKGKCGSLWQEGFWGRERKGLSGGRKLYVGFYLRAGSSRECDFPESTLPCAHVEIWGPERESAPDPAPDRWRRSLAEPDDGERALLCKSRKVELFRDGDVVSADKIVAWFEESLREALAWCQSAESAAG